MTFAQPLALSLLPAVAVYAWWIFHRRHAAHGTSLGRIARLWADRRGLTAIPPVSHRRGRGLLFAGAAILGVIALARPQWGQVDDVRYRHAREVLVALDLSRSMLADDVTPTRFDRAKLLTENLVDEVRGDRVGLLLFAGSAFVQVPLSADTEVLRALLPQIDPSYIPQGGTRFGQMIDTAVEAFSTGAADRYLIVLSDGEALDESWKTAVPALAQRGIKVIALGIGTDAGALVPAADGGAVKDASGAAVLSRLEPASLESLATTTGGVYRTAAAWVDIPELIAETVARGDRGAFVETRSTREPDRYQWFLAPAVLCGLLSLWLEFPITLTLPRTLRRPGAARPAQAAAALLLIIPLWASPRSASAAGAAPPERQGRTAPPTVSTLPPLPNDRSEREALEAAVGRIAIKPNPAAPDYADLARATVAYASAAPRNARTESERTQTISDALVAVGHGERLDPQAADWSDLRRQLEQLLAPPPPSEPEQENPGRADSDGSRENTGQSSDSAAPSADAGDDPADPAQGETASGTQSGQPDARPSAEAESQEGNAQADGDAEDAQTPPQERNGTTSNGAPSTSAASQKFEAEGHETRPEESAAAAEKAESDGGAGEPDTRNLDAHHDDAAQKPQSVTATGSQERRPATDESDSAATIGGGTVHDPATAGAATRAAEALAALRRADAPAVLFDRMKAAEGRAVQPPSEKDW